LSLHAASSVVSPPGRAPVDDPAALAFYRDLVQPFGSTVDEELLRRGNHVHHRDLVDLVAASEQLRDARPQLVIVTHALPDVLPFTAVAPHLNMRLGGAATSFSISQQGLAAPFTALRVAAAYRRGGRSDDTVVAVLEQTTLPTRFPLVHDTPLVDSAVLLWLRAGEGPLLGRVESTDNPAESLARWCDVARRTLVVFGSWVAPLALPEKTAEHRVPPGNYCTGVWLALAQHWCEWQTAYDAVVLCDTDPQTGRSHLAEFTS
jgi:hypothetical protein